MKSRFKKLNVILILAISFFIPLFSTYLEYYNLSGTVILFDDMSFEDTYDEDLSIFQNDFNAPVPIAFSRILFQSDNLIEQYCLFYSPITSYSQNKSILRC
jgi:hypothetical protein